MRMKLVLGATIACMLAATLAAAAGEFDRVFASVYTDLIHDSRVAYDGKRYEQAFPLMLKAACAGDKESQWIVGHMFLLGQGVARDDLQGYAWMKTAAEFEWAEYRSTVNKIESAINAEQRPIANAEAAKMLENYGLRATKMSCNKAASRGGHIQDTITCTPQQDGTLMLLKQCMNPTAGSPAP